MCIRDRVKISITDEIVPPVANKSSIIAKVYRDKLINKLHLKDNVYQWNKNAGYGTKNHLDAIYSHGVSKFHRTTYQPISKLIKKLST